MPRLLSDVRMSTSAQVRRIWSSERGFWDPGAMVPGTAHPRGLHGARYRSETCLCVHARQPYTHVPSP